jgi:hypothetical protein
MDESIKMLFSFRIQKLLFFHLQFLGSHVKNSALYYPKNPIFPEERAGE